MEKAGWQVVASIAGMLAIAGAFGTYANKKAAEQALVDLKAAQAANKETVTVHEIHQTDCKPYVAPEDSIGMKPWPKGAECKGGVLLMRTANGWESIIANGTSIPCRP